MYKIQNSEEIEREREREKFGGNNLPEKEVKYTLSLKKYGMGTQRYKEIEESGKR